MFAGDTRKWLQHFPDVEERAIACITAVWPNILSRISSVTHENQITITLAFFLQQNPVATNIGAIDYLTKQLALGPYGPAHISAETDLRFRLGNDPDSDLVFECKRLRVAYPSGFRVQADTYVSDGLMRFYSGQYSGRTSLAGMLGYVMDGNAIAAEADVAHQISMQGAKVGLVGKGVTTLAAVAGNVRLVSMHTRNHKPIIEVRHTFLPL
jgi:hypothetical protein